MPSRQESPDHEGALRAAFPMLDEEAMIEAENVLRDTGLGAGELYVKWEAYAMRRKRGTEPPSASELRALRNEVMKGSARKPRVSSKAESRVTPVKAPPRLSVNDFFAYADAEMVEQLVGDDGDGVVDAEEDDEFEIKSRVKTEVKEEDKLASMDTSEGPLIRSAERFGNEMEGSTTLPGDDTKSAFYERDGVGRALCTLGEEPKDVKGGVVALSMEKRYQGMMRYMNDDLRGRVEATRAHLRELGARIVTRAKQTQQLPPVSAECFTTPSSDTVVAVGRVRVDLSGGQDGAAAGRINERAVLLESEDGHWMRLDLEKMRQQQLFLHRGMIAAVEGVNTNGRQLTVTAVHNNALGVSVSDVKQEAMDVKLEPEAVKQETTTDVKDEPKEADADAMDTGDGGKQDKDDEQWVRVLVASGPYSCMGNLRYEALSELCAAVRRDKPDVVVFMGPFVDTAHKLVDDTLPVPFDKIFEERVAARISQLATDCDGTQFVVVPSLGDAHHDHVCPQPPLTADTPMPHNVLLAANPSVVSVRRGGRSATLALTTLPTLADISADALCWNQPDRFGAIVAHMLRQGSFYPSDPPGADVPLDSTLRRRLELPTDGVDALVVPSKLKAFAKVVQGTVAVNPGLLARGNSGGTYALLTLPLRSTQGLRDRQRWSEKCAASVLRI